MKEETERWLSYADENLQSAKLLLESRLYNPTLQNVQQAVEKMLKAALVEFSIKFRKTHSINELVALLTEHDCRIELAEDEKDLLDSIYLPSKYPLAGLLPNFEPDAQICRKCIDIAQRTRDSVEKFLTS